MVAIVFSRTIRRCNMRTVKIAEVVPTGIVLIGLFLGVGLLEFAGATSMPLPSSMTSKEFLTTPSQSLGTDAKPDAEIRGAAVPGVDQIGHTGFLHTAADKGEVSRNPTNPRILDHVDKSGRALPNKGPIIRESPSGNSPPTGGPCVTDPSSDECFCLTYPDDPFCGGQAQADPNDYYEDPFLEDPVQYPSQRDCEDLGGTARRFEETDPFSDPCHGEAASDYPQEPMEEQPLQGSTPWYEQLRGMGQ